MHVKLSVFMWLFILYIFLMHEMKLVFMFNLAQMMSKISEQLNTLSFKK